LVRIDFATNDIAAEIPFQGEIWRNRIAATDDAVWLASSGLLERIDPSTNTVVARVELPDRSISALAADDDDVWVVTIADDGGRSGFSSGSIQRRTRSQPRSRSVARWSGTRTR
jgi:hypothetical protein